DPAGDRHSLPGVLGELGGQNTRDHDSSSEGRCMTPWECGGEGNSRCHRTFTARNGRPLGPCDGGQAGGAFPPRTRECLRRGRGTAITAPGGSLGPRGPGYSSPSTRCADGISAVLLLSLLSDLHGDLDGRAGEAELLAQAPFDEAPVGLFEPAGGEQHELGRLDRRLGGEEDLRLLAA